MAVCGVTKGELINQTRALFDEAITADPLETESLIMQCFNGATVFSWTCITMKRLTALRRGLYRIVLTARG